MRKWLLLGVLALVIAGAAFAARQNGWDVTALANVNRLMGNAADGARPQAKDQAGQKPQQGRNSNRGAIPVEVALTRTERISDEFYSIGTLLANESVEITAETSGRVDAILFQDGEKVEKGAPLFRLDSELAQAELAEAKAKFSLAQANFGRSQSLRKAGNVAQSTYDEAFTAQEVARSAVDLAQVKLDKLTIRAPFSGTLGFRKISVGAYVTAGMPLVQLDDTARLKASFSIPEMQQGRIAMAQDVTLTADAMPGETFTATVSAIEPMLDVNGRALRVRAEIDNSYGKLKPGLLLRVGIKGNPRDAVIVPEAAIVRRGDKSFVFLVQNGKAKQAEVSLGKRFNGNIEITSGLASGAEIAVAGNSRLTEGADVDVVRRLTAAD